MARRIFISYQHGDQMQAKGFHLLRWNRNVDCDFVGRHLLDPVNSSNEAYIWSKIREQLNGTSATVVLVGADTCDSDWVRREIEASVEKGNGILAIKLPDGGDLPTGSPVGDALRACGAEVIDWQPHEFADAIERACRGTSRIKAMRATVGPGGGCGR